MALLRRLRCPIAVLLTLLLLPALQLLLQHLSHTRLSPTLLTQTPLPPVCPPHSHHLSPLHCILHRQIPLLKTLHHLTLPITIVRVMTSFRPLPKIAKLLLIHRIPLLLLLLNRLFPLLLFLRLIFTQHSFLLLSKLFLFRFIWLFFYRDYLLQFFLINCLLLYVFLNC